MAALSHSALSKDNWSTHASAYQTTLGSGRPNANPITSTIVSLLAAANTARPFSSASRILDVGTGTAAVVEALLSTHNAELPLTTQILATDFSAGMVAIVQKKADDLLAQGNDGWKRVRPAVVDAQDMSAMESSSVSHITSSMVLMLVPDGFKALREMHRVLEPGGVAAITTWEKLGWMEIAAQAVGRVKPGQEHVFKLPQAWSTPAGVRSVLEQAGFVNVQVAPQHTFMAVANPREFADGFIKGSNPGTLMLVDGMSEDEKDKAADVLYDLLLERFPDGVGNVQGTAIVATGRKGN
ncbi:S-adenosyl-L-methionine-dependent methyltransferase [Gonapodya prolifera JEL478]|uniref:S-adenosyl-L-methionine-dependent methyltransferase n=1 Tax=Gonapodya prolifera (strain JEL478) TaxID=1344416 RepID=A0A139AH66_GONPJ|nr:S-adenosyl-L-methionine-dependent methyltransferase [Gonapodya prolifera JEL478]|eukprot:KXS15785.1 S-adenosyl-L-methionine-dependent methyltransferase [Gonapodya prolifera JEL478]